MIVELPDVPRIPKRISPDAAQVDGQRHAVGWTLFLVLAVLLTASASANAQSVPEPPTLCDGSGNTCSDDPVTEDPPPSSAVRDRPRRMVGPTRTGGDPPARSPTRRARRAPPR